MKFIVYSGAESHRYPVAVCKTLDLAHAVVRSLMARWLTNSPNTVGANSGSYHIEQSDIELPGFE